MLRVESDSLSNVLFRHSKTTDILGSTGDPGHEAEERHSGVGQALGTREVGDRPGSTAGGHRPPEYFGKALHSDLGALGPLHSGFLKSFMRSFDVYAGVLLYAE